MESIHDHPLAWAGIGALTAGGGAILSINTMAQLVRWASEVTKREAVRHFNAEINAAMQQNKVLPGTVPLLHSELHSELADPERKPGAAPFPKHPQALARAMGSGAKILGGGASGALVALAEDRSVVVKSATPHEQKLTMLCEGELEREIIALGKAEIAGLARSLLMPTLLWLGGNGGGRLWQVMPSLVRPFAGLPQKVYDLKGYGNTPKRAPLYQQLISLETNQEMDFEKEVGAVKLSPRDFAFVQGALSRDIQALAQSNLVDYSLLLVVSRAADVTAQQAPRAPLSDLTWPAVFPAECMQMGGTVWVSMSIIDFTKTPADFSAPNAQGVAHAALGETQDAGSYARRFKEALVGDETGGGFLMARVD